ncbi:MAG TPA: DNA polymerase Y family protein [Dehalococcoidia bacterium]|nr:DNA polymerase Y family protein [Dehalococcoidia bacterium]
MRIAFVSIPRFPCAVEVLHRPQLTRRPLIVGDAEEPKRVLDCSQDAGDRGVQRGMTVRQALGKCPEAVIVPPDPVLYRQTWESILDALSDVSPEVEDEEWGRAYVNAGGLEAHYRDDEALTAEIVTTIRDASGLEAGVGLANSKFLAFAVATCPPADQRRVVPADGEGAFLAPLDVRLLPVEPEVVYRLQLFGLDTIGQVAALTLPELQSQFGFEGRRLWQLVNGLDDEPLRPRPPQEKVAATLSFEAPVAGIDVMVAAAKQLLSRLRPSLRGRAARELALQAELTTGRGWERQVVLREAVSESERLAFVLRSALQNAPPPNAVRSISLRLGGLTGETGKQLSLDRKRRLQRQLEEAIRQLKARYGYSPVYRCVDVEPWSVIPEERQILVESDD